MTVVELKTLRKKYIDRLLEEADYAQPDTSRSSMGSLRSTKLAEWRKNLMDRIDQLTVQIAARQPVAMPQKTRIVI